jgi:hypothetical protein
MHICLRLKPYEFQSFSTRQGRQTRFQIAETIELTESLFVGVPVWVDCSVDHCSTTTFMRAVGSQQFGSTPWKTPKVPLYSKEVNSFLQIIKLTLTLRLILSCPLRHIDKSQQPAFQRTRSRTGLHKPRGQGGWCMPDRNPSEAQLTGRFRSPQSWAACYIDLTIMLARPEAVRRVFDAGGKGRQLIENGRHHHRGSRGSKSPNRLVSDRFLLLRGLLTISFLPFLA